MLEIIRYKKYPLLVSFTIQILGLILFAIHKVQNILPTGNNDFLDSIYAYRGIIEGCSLTVSYLLILSLLFRKKHKGLLAVICVSMGVFVWMKQEWCLVFFYPILVWLQNKTENSDGSDRTSVTRVSVLELYPLSSLAIAVFFSGFLLMTIQIPFPHHVSVLDVLYIQSQSSILIITGVLIFGLIFWSIHFLLEKTIKNGVIYEGLFLFLLLLISFINFALYSADTFGSFIEQFELTSVPFMVSGLLCNILLLIFGRIQIGASFTSQLNALHDGLTYRKFWIKTLFTFLFFRQLYGWLNQADQNFLVEVIYDVTNVILPFLSFWLVLGIIVRFVKLVNHPFIFRSIALLLVIVALVPGVVFRQKNWTVGLELNRLTSRFYSSRSREILSFIGLDVERETQKKANIFKKSIKVLSKESSLVLSDVFKNSFDQKSKKRIHDYFSDPPNIFVVLSDATYARRLSVYGHSNKTSPVLEKFASEAVLFKNFYSTSSATFQGVASLFTGQYIGNYPHKLNGTRDTLCLSLKKKNYKLLLSSVITTVSFSKEKIQCQETPLLSYKGDEKEDWDKIRNAIEKSPDRPLFVYFHMLGGHDPWTLPEEELIFGKGKLDKYDALLYKADRQFGDILENLRKLSIYENSIIIFSSDHGIGLGKHLDQSSYSRTYNVNLQIPFLIKIPGVNASQVSNVYSLIDIRPSLEELLGIQNDVPLHGVSFVSEFNSSGLQKERCVFGIATYRNYFSMQCSSGIKIIYQKDYDFLDMFNSFSDPWELSSLIDQYSTENFENLAYPFIKFIAFGGKSYAFTK